MSFLYLNVGYANLFTNSTFVEDSVIEYMGTNSITNRYNGFMSRHLYTK